MSSSSCWLSIDSTRCLTILATLEELIAHGLRALRECLPSEQELTIKVGLHAGYLFGDVNFIASNATALFNHSSYIDSKMKSQANDGISNRCLNGATDRISARRCMENCVIQLLSYPSLGFFVCLFLFLELLIGCRRSKYAYESIRQ